MTTYHEAKMRLLKARLQDLEDAERVRNVILTNSGPVAMYKVNGMPDDISSSQREVLVEELTEALNNLTKIVT